MMKNVLLIVVAILFVTAASAQENRIKVACIGNSITYGYGLPDRTTQSYPAQLQKMLGESYQVENFGKSGATLLNKGHRPYMQQDEFRERSTSPEILWLFIWASMIQIPVIGPIIVISL